MYVLEGNTSLPVRLAVLDGGKPAPNRAVDLARTAIDRELAADVLGEPLTGARGLVGEGDEVACSFHGERASLEVSSSSDPDLMFQLEDMRSWAGKVCPASATRRTHQRRR